MFGAPIRPTHCLQVALATGLVGMTGSTFAATVDAVDPLLGVTGSSVTLEGSGFDSPGATKYSSTGTSGTDFTVTIANSPPNNDYYVEETGFAIDTSIYRYAQVYYSLDDDFTGTTHQLRLDTTAQSPNFVAFNNASSIPANTGAHSYVVDLNDGTTDLGGGGYSGNLNYIRWDFFNNPGNENKTFTIDRIVFAPEVTDDPSPDKTLIFSDSFNTSNNSDLATDAGTRQAGSLATSGYSKYSSTGSSISDGQLLTVSGAGVESDFDLTAALTDPTVGQFTVAFDLANTSAGTEWTSPFLTTHDDNNSVEDRSDSEFGFILFGNGNLSAYSTTGNVGLTDAELQLLLGTWDESEMNAFELIADPITSTSGTYDIVINGITVLSGLAYTFGDGGDNGELNFEIRNISGGIGVYDDLVITTSPSVIPEPASLALLGVGGLLIAGRRRR